MNNKIKLYAKMCEITKSKGEHAFILLEDGMSQIDLKKVSDITYSHLVKIIKKWYIAGLISMEKKTKTYNIKLTENGKDVQYKQVIYYEARVSKENN